MTDDTPNPGGWPDAARREGIEAAALAAQKHAVSEGWSNTSALRFRNCIRALLEDG